MRLVLCALFAAALAHVPLVAVLGAPAATDDGVYRKPHQTGIDLAVITRAEQALAGRAPPDCARHRADLSREIAKYTTQFVGNRRIQDERRTVRYDPRNLDKNTIRLLTIARKREFGRVYFLGESPLMYRLHRAMGMCYQREKKNYRALSEFAMAFRYSGLEDAWQDLPDLRADRLTPLQLQQREQIYMAMLAGFADPDRLKEEADAALRTAGERFRALMARYARIKPQATEARRTIDAMIARRARGDATANPATARAAFARLDTTRLRLLNEMDQVRRDSYRTFHKAKSQRDGDLAYRMALLIKGLEFKNKRIKRILNRSSFYRGRGDTLAQDNTRLNRFVGYGIFLELANKLDPNNLKYLSLLAEEYRTSRLSGRAIAFEERYIELAARATPPPTATVLAEHLVRLAGLYTDTRNYIKATVAYTRALTMDPDATRRIRVRRHLAELHFHRTGNFRAAQRLFREHLTATTNADPRTLGYKQRTEYHASRYRVFNSLATISRRFRRTEREKANMVAAKQEFDRIEADYVQARRDERELRRRINRLKRVLLRREDDRLQLQYYRLIRRELPDRTERTGHLRTHLESLNVAALLERQAILALRERRFNTAKDRYREIIRRGTGAQATRARGNIRRINLSLADGISRAPILPPNYER